ncbi:acyl-CoA dehydrogenase family protein [Novosphingobium pentaromativorans]|uniref:Medium-chain specific acyl-CoA dehydrogenase, mitochondrial n=1 Tax=Novosphingobium pentaromativorans US6-1 TaxID=1088721 RepID=G6EAT9_9SPHN|nr:acyl-CoA dehydrogenase family protein [Novosphingobium pentaromativorans]AIT80572.1 acyl-CoA dehydrogenase [Novosphingobium pentaromativorans US6-1]EHJ61726.1 acyl-CoA dehydrogenase [Novosphingobium pentaromativorans US6-1]
MNFELNEDFSMLRDLVARFVKEEMLPLEPAVLEREAMTGNAALTTEEEERLRSVSKDMGLWSLDAPEDVGGMALPHVAMVGVNEELGKSAVAFHLPPDSPNLQMLMATVNDAQRQTYLAPYAQGDTVSAIGISEPGAGSDPKAMKARAVKDGDDWIINGRKIWITRADEADFTILMANAEVDGEKRGISAFLVDADLPGFEVVRPIPMIGGEMTYEVLLEDCRVPGDRLLGELGKGFAPMQVRLGTRRLQIACWSIGMAQRALDMVCEYAPQRQTFGMPLSKRGGVQDWVGQAATRIHAARLMTYDCAWKLDEGRDTRREISMIKAFSTEMAWDIVDHAMQLFGAMGMTREMPLHLMASRIRTMRIYDGPTEIHNWVIGRDVLAG